MLALYFKIGYNIIKSDTAVMNVENILETYERKSEPFRKKMAKSHAAASRDAKEDGSIHGTYQFENLMLSYIRDGETEKLRELFSKAEELQGQNVGVLAADPLRQEKNLLIGLAAVVGKVAGIGGGMDVEDAYRLIDLYTQECEKTESVEGIYLLRFNMVMDFTERVRQAKLPANISPEMFQAVQYINAHTCAVISLDDVAGYVGVSRSYLTRRFRAEIGKSIGQFIAEAKIREAKRLLRYSDMTISEIGNYLCFSSQGYFQTVFKKEAGMTPGEYRRNHTG